MRQVQVAPANVQSQKKTFSNSLGLPSHSFRPTAPVSHTRVVVDEKRTGYETSIWTVAATGNEPPLRMTNGKHDTNPRWSPDGRYIAFVRGGEKDETGKPRPAQIAILPLAGGEAWTITDLPKGASNPVWSPDSKTIVFLSTTTPEDIAKAERKKKKPE